MSANYESKTEDGKCIFCEIANKIIRPMGNGEFWEDENYLAFLSPFPNMLGTAAIITKKHFGSDCLDMPDKELAEFILAAKKAAKILLDYFEDVGRVGLIMEGTGIDHAHIKLYPMHGTENLKKGKWKQMPSKVETYFASYEGYVCSNDGPKADFVEIEELAKKIMAKTIRF